MHKESLLCSSKMVSNIPDLVIAPGVGSWQNGPSGALLWWIWGMLWNILEMNLCLIGSERQASGPGSSDSHFATVREGGPGVVPAEGWCRRQRPRETEPSSRYPHELLDETSPEARRQLSFMWNNVFVKLVWISLLLLAMRNVWTNPTFGPYFNC